MSDREWNENWDKIFGIERQPAPQAAAEIVAASEVEDLKAQLVNLKNLYDAALVTANTERQRADAAERRLEGAQGVVQELADQLPPRPQGSTLDELRRDAWFDSCNWFPGLHGTGQMGLLMHMAIGVVAEAGEAADEVKKYHRKAVEGRLVEGTTWPEMVEKIELELADTLIYAFHIATICGIDMDAALARKRAFNEERFGNR